MDYLSGLSAFFTLPFLVLIISIGFLTYIVRRYIEKIAEKIAIKTPDRIDRILEWGWREFLLPILPIIISVTMGVLFSYPVPDELSDSRSRHVYYAVAGLISSWSYPRIRHLFRQKGEK
jgi:hypothetical protein